MDVKIKQDIIFKVKLFRIYACNASEIFLNQTIFDIKEDVLKKGVGHCPSTAFLVA